MRTNLPREALDAVADALEYPHDRSERAARAAARALSDVDATAAGAFEALADWMAATERWQQEELYTRLFDLKAACTLHIGYHVWGEAYQRGALLAGLVRELEIAEIDPGHELPDYLPTVLRLWSRLDHDEHTELFHDRVLAVALDRMTKDLRRLDTPWAAAVCSLTSLFPAPADELDAKTEAQRNWEALYA